MVLPVGIGLPTGPGRASLVGRSSTEATRAWALANPAGAALVPAVPPAAVVLAPVLALAALAVAAAAVVGVPVAEPLLSPPQPAATRPPTTRTDAASRPRRPRVMRSMVRVPLLVWPGQAGVPTEGAGGAPPAPA